MIQRISLRLPVLLVCATALASLGGCKKDDPAAEPAPVAWPLVDPAKLPHPATGLSVGVTSETDAHLTWQGLTRDADTSLGGKGTVSRNGAPAARWHGASGDGRAELWFSGSPLALQGFEIMEKGRDFCRWAEQTGGPDAKSRGCPGSNRVMGGVKGGFAFCGVTPAGKSVVVECTSNDRGETLSVSAR